MGYIKNMKPKPKKTKCMALDRDMVLVIEKLAKQEHRSFTKQAESLLASALERQKRQPTAAAS